MEMRRLKYFMAAGALHALAVWKAFHGKVEVANSVARNQELFDNNLHKSCLIVFLSFKKFSALCYQRNY